MDLAVDMHARYDATTGKRVAMEVEPFHLLWLEEPVPPENVDAMADIQALHKNAHLLRRKSVYALGLSTIAGKARRRYHHAGHSKSGRAFRSSQDCKHGADLLRALCSPLCCFPSA